MPALPEISFTYILLFAAFVVPGSISLFVYGLIQPSAERTLKDLIFESIVLSIINFMLLFWPIYEGIAPDVISQNPEVTWIVLLLCLLVAPALWPILLHFTLETISQRINIAVGSKTAWDEFFRVHGGHGCWVIVTLNDDTRIGGRYSKNSFASAFPREGHIYIQELWDVDDEEKFIGERPGPQGLILRPADYKFLKVIKTEHSYA